MRSANPALSPSTFGAVRYQAERTEAMTVQGTALKTIMLVLLALLSAGWVWMKFYQNEANPALMTPWVGIGVLGGFIVAIVTVFKKEWAPITAPIYAVLEGLFIGGISAQLETAFPGIVVQAVGLTFGTLFSMLLVYQSGLIKVTDNFRMGVAAATGGIALFYIAMLVLGFFGIHPDFFYGSSMMSIGISLFIVGIAALNFVIDFDFIVQGARMSVPKYMEWYGAFALMVTLVWLYIEFLRLLSKLRER